MANLLIVESPGKLKTLRKILGAGWLLEASVGHTTELAHDGPKRLGFEIQGDRVETHYIARGDRGRQVLAKLKQAARKATRVYLATDPDREGEAIAWHLVQQLGLRNYCRVSYTQITESAVRSAIQNPGSIDLALVESQRARQCLDKLVGYEVSPLLWSSTGGKSAGRVQSATLHLICERERERLSFKPERYWVLRSSYGEGFDALYEHRPVTEKVRTRDEAALIAEVARSSAHIVDSRETKEEARNPPPPLITSSLQQSAGARFRYSPKKTMQIAQELYEGIGGKGLITYMRTDSIQLSAEFTNEARAWIRENEPEALSDRAAAFRAGKDAQAAHEAIRPTSAMATPSSLKGLNRDQLNIYTLIWERAMASQCKPARLSKTKLVIRCGDTRWVAHGMTILDPGYLRFWNNIENESKLPVVREGAKLDFRDVKMEEKTTEPPSRYTEPKLVQLMEKKGIGRPSTYASTIAILKERDYAELEKNFIVPTPLGMVTDETLMRAMPDLVNAEFTAKMEASLDDIAERKLAWEKYLAEWNRGYLEPAVKSAKALLGTPEKSGARGGPPRKSGATARAPVSSEVLQKATEKARKSGPLPVCAEGHGELKLAVSKKGGYYWRCSKPECKSFAWHQTFSSEKCPVCSLSLEKIKTRKVSGGYFLKCARKESHPDEVVLFRDRKSGKWERARGKV